MRRLRLQVIGVLFLVALLPSVPAALLVHAIVQRSLESRITEQVDASARAGLASTRDLLRMRRAAFVERLHAGADLDTLTTSEIANLDERTRETLRGMADRAGAGEAIAPALAGPDRVTLGEAEALVALMPSRDGAPVWIVDRLPGEWVQRAEQLTESVRLVETLKRERGPVVRSLVLTFLAVYGGILLLVVALGLLVASRVTRPLEALATGIRRVDAGDWDTAVDTHPSGTLGPLITQFNHMVQRLRGQQDDLVRLEKVAAWRGLARRLAHEIKNPLTPIQLAAQQMRDAYDGSNDAHRELLVEGTSIIEEEVASLRSLVKEFSQFARLPEPSRRDLDLTEALQPAAALYGAERLTLHCPPGLRVHADPEQLHRVLINLINNALRAQSDAGVTSPVEVRAERVGERTLLRVLDRGPGVPTEHHRRVFEPDFSTASEGMGLGLAIVEGMIHAHGGTIHVENRSGGGAVFVIDLPTESAS